MRKQRGKQKKKQKKKKTLGCRGAWLGRAGSCRAPRSAPVLFCSKRTHSIVREHILYVYLGSQGVAVRRDQHLCCVYLYMYSTHVFSTCIHMFYEWIHHTYARMLNTSAPVLCAFIHVYTCIQHAYLIYEHMPESGRWRYSALEFPGRMFFCEIEKHISWEPILVFGGFGMSPMMCFSLTKLCL